MRILLIEPSTGKRQITTFDYPPMGLMALSGFLRKKGHITYIYDMNQDKRPPGEMLHEFSPDFVGVTAMSVNYHTALDICKIVKKYSCATTVMGGIHPSLYPYECSEHTAVNHVVVGEGELSFLQIINGCKDKVVKNELIKNLDDLPIPDYSIYNHYRYCSPYSQREPFAAMVRSRGCIFDCSFCGNANMYGKVFRCQSPERTIEEIEYLVEVYGIRELSFKDTELTLDPKLHDLLELLCSRKFDLSWTCNGRASNANVSLLQLLKRAGCYSITYGIESGDEQILKIIKKPITLDSARFAVEQTKKAGIGVVLNFMIGLPYDTEETIQKTIDFAIELEPDYVYFGFATPFPGTKMRELALEKGWILDYRLNSIRYDSPIMNATTLTNEKLELKLKYAYHKFYFRPRYIFNHFKNMNWGKFKSSVKGICRLLS